MALPGMAVSGLFGILLFQQQATMWSAVVFYSALSVLLLLAIVRSLSRVADVRYVWTQMLVYAAVIVVAYAYAQSRAYIRLHDRLPAQCQQQHMTVQGIIVSVPERNALGQSLTLQVEQVARKDCPVTGRLRLSLYRQSFKQQTSASDGPAHPLFQAGERWRFMVKLKQPHATRNPHGFDYAAWCLANRISAVGSIVSKAPMRRLQPLVWQPAALIARWRQVVGERISRSLGPTPESAVLRALVTGDDSQIDRTHWQLFVDTGINHLISISGLHITMLASLGYWLAQFLWRLRPSLALWIPSKQAATLAGAMVAVAYAALAGFSVPTQRTLYMVLTVALMLNVRRQYPFSWVLSAALWTVLLLDPWAVLAPGFWLSFGAVAVLAFAMGGRLRAPAFWQAAVHSQWVVTLAFVPLLCAMFNQISLVSPLANAIAIPVISLVVVPLAIAGALLPVDLMLHMAAWVCHGCLWALQGLQHWPWAVWYQATPPLWATALAVVGVLVMLMPRGWPLRWAGLLLCLPLTLPVTPRLISGQMRVTVLDVGQGLSVLVQTASHTLLYDAGPAFGLENDAGQRIVVPYLRHLGVQQLSMAVISHDDSDHVGGMASVLQAIPAQRVTSSLGPQAEFFRQMQGLPLQHFPCHHGQHWQWDGVVFDMLAPDNPADTGSKDNDKSCVLRVRSAHGSLLLTGDIERIAEQRLLNSGVALQATVMTIPHHGSKTSSSPAFVQAVAPRWAIATAGYLNRFGHPKPEVMQRYRAQASQVLRSDQAGAVIMAFLHADTPDVDVWRQVAPHYWETHDL